MTRSFDGTPIEATLLDELCATALWAPTAGNSAGVRLSTFDQHCVTAYLEVATDQAWRERSRRAPGLARAGGLVLVTTRVQDYLERYGEADKAPSELATRAGWPLPYWLADAAMATMALLLLLEEAGWQAALWGNFRNGDEVLRWAGLADEELFATVFVGRDDGNDVTSSSLGRQVPSRRERVRRLHP